MAEVKTSSAGLVTPSQQFRQQQASSTATVKTPTVKTPAPTAPVSRKGEQGGTTAVTPASTTKPPVVVKPPVVNKPAAPKVDAAKIVAGLTQVTAKLETNISNLRKIAFDVYGATIDENGNIISGGAGATVVSSKYVGTGKDRQRVDTMSDGTTRTFSDPDTSVQDDDVVVGTKDIDVLKAVLKGKGFPSTLVDDSVTFLTALKKEGLDNESISQIYLNNKDYTTKGGTVLTSPFYSKYGFYNDALTDKYTPSELFNVVEGYKDVANKFNLDPKFTSTDYTQKYLKNKLSVDAFNEGANQARLAAVTADSAYVEALKKMGYISASQGLTDFFLDPDVGVEKMKQNVNTASIALEAVRRSNAETGVVVNAEDIKKYGAALTAQGLSAGQVAGVASKGYATIAASLQPMTKLSDIYNRPAAKTKTDIQKELEQQEFQGIESNLQKRLTEQEIMAFNARSGLTSQSLSSRSIAGQI